MTKKNLIIAPCGNSSKLFKDDWLADKENKDFDVCLLFYHEHIIQPGAYQDVEYFFHLKNFKYLMIHELLTVIKPELLSQYEYFYLIDDDIAIDTQSINKLFELSRTFDTWISQASLTQRSYCSWPILKNKPNCFARYMGQIEVMAPMFNRYAIQKCLPSFKANKSSWGLDSAWSKILDYPADKLVVFDAVQMEHTMPVGGGELYKKIKADPVDEWDAVTESFDARKNNFTEYGRLQFINGSHSKIQRSFIAITEKLDKSRQWINDFGIIYRVKNRLGIK